jgi:hypothetical protein
MVCSKETSGEEVDKPQGGFWKTRFEILERFNQCLMNYKYMVPFLRANNLQLMEQSQTFFIQIFGHMSSYQKFVEDFYISRMLFYTLYSAPNSRLKITPAMKRFFSHVHDMEEFSLFSRKTVLNGYLFGIIKKLFNIMIGDDTPSKKYLLKRVLQYCLAKKAQFLAVL